MADIPIQARVELPIPRPSRLALIFSRILQRATPWYDGVPAVQQCPIAPGKSLTYTFKADLFGSSWYHSHYSAQYAGGAFGGWYNMPGDLYWANN